MIQISLAGEFIRLHRPFVGEFGDCFLSLKLTNFAAVLAGSNKLFQYSRDQAVKYSKLVLAIYKSPSCSRHPWGGITYKASSVSRRRHSLAAGGECDCCHILIHACTLTGGYRTGHRDTDVSQRERGRRAEIIGEGCDRPARGSPKRLGENSPHLL